MIKISKQNNSLIVEGIENVFYPNNGDNSYPLNSLIVITDNSDMATFRSVATNDVLFSGLIKDITINGEAVTKDNIIQKFDAVSNSSTGGAVDAYTKEEADNKFASKDELANVQTVANDADTKVDALTPRVESVETTLGNKQDTLVSGTNIKTINSQSILGSGDLAISGVSEEQAQEIAKIPTLETELAQKANVSDVPTVQTGLNGTNKNYVYSNAGSSKNNDKVISHFEFIANAPDKLDMDLFYWGDEGIMITDTIPLATSYTAGIMSSNDKTKLDSIPETIPSQSEIDGIAADVSALQTAMDGKQPTLVSGTNIKTINNKSILGEGNLEITGGDVDLTNYYTKTETDTKLDAKQNTLVSGTNIKTINNQSILGSGDLTISGVSEEQAQEIAKIPTLETELAQKANVSDVPTVQTNRNGTNKNYVYSYADSDKNNDKVVSSCYFHKSGTNRLDMDLVYWGDDGARLMIPVPLATSSTAGIMSGDDKTKLDSISNEWTGTQSEYDALTTKDNNTIYYVTE